MTKRDYDLDYRIRLTAMLSDSNAGGNDLAKRNVAIEAMCGPPTLGGVQTKRLLMLALAIVEGRL